MKISDMNIVITGANGSLAAFLLDYFANQAAFVVGTVRHLAKTSKPKNNEAIIEMDPLDHYSIDEAISWIQNEAGDIHVWMNIIGGFIMGNHVEEGHDDWPFMYNTNFMTALNCCQQILPHMKQINCGKIVNIGSQLADRGMPLAGPYCASKLAVHSLTKTVALENGPHISCNALLPGVIDTSDNRMRFPEADYESWTTVSSIAEKISEIILTNVSGQLIKI
mgnify:CR=1 FL=1